MNDYTLSANLDNVFLSLADSTLDSIGVKPLAQSVHYLYQGQFKRAAKTGAEGALRLGLLLAGAWAVRKNYESLNRFDYYPTLGPDGSRRLEYRASRGNADRVAKFCYEIAKPDLRPDYQHIWDECVKSTTRGPLELFDQVVKDPQGTADRARAHCESITPHLPRPPLPVEVKSFLDRYTEATKAKNASLTVQEVEVIQSEYTEDLKNYIDTVNGETRTKSIRECLTNLLSNDTETAQRILLN